MPTRSTPPRPQARTIAKQKAFLDAYSQRANITAACGVAGIKRATVFVWRERDEQFALAYREADLIATERLENEAWRRATEGTRYKKALLWHGEVIGYDEKIEYSDALLIMLLKARKPDVYRDKLDVAITQVVKAIGGVDPLSVL